MHKLLRIVLLWAVVSSTLAAPLAAAQPPRGAEMTQNRPDTVSLTLTAERPALKESSRAEGLFTTFETPLTLTGEPGSPALPLVSRMVGLPYPTAPQVAISLAPSEELGALTSPLEPVPTQIPIPTEGNILGDSLESHYLTDSALYEANEWYPANPISVSEPMTLRGQAMVRVSFSPVQVNLATGQLRWTPTADISLTWSPENRPPLSEFSDRPSEDPAFEAVFANLLSNYDEARQWRSAPQPDSTLQASPTGGDSWTIKLQGKGLYRISLSDLAARGVPVANPSRIAIYYGSGASEQEQALWQTADALYLVNTREPGRWSREVAYRLEIKATAAKRMAELPSAASQSASATSVPYTLRLEDDRTYMSVIAQAGPMERWYWSQLSVFNNPALGTPNFETTFALPHRVPGSSAQLTVELWPLYQRCHYARIRVNGTQRGERGLRNATTCASGSSRWNDLSPFNQTMTIPSSGLSATNNTFRVETEQYSSIGVDTLMLNSFTVRYQRNLVAETGSFFFESDRSTPVNFRVSTGSTRIWLPMIRTAVTANTSAPESDLTMSTGAVLPAAFEVSQTGDVKRLIGDLSGNGMYSIGRSAPAGEKYLVASQAMSVASITRAEDRGLRDTSQHTDYLIIAPPEFAAALQPLLAHREGEGHDTRLVTTTDVYNDFGTGATDPQAIRDFIQYAYRNWNPNPTRLSYVLLVGDATYDPFDIMGSGDKLWVPPMMVNKDIYVGEVPSDNAYVSGLDAGDSPNDPIPDVHIGRLPANSVADVNAMVSKILDYENSPAAGDWKRRILLLADDIPDAAGNFHQLSEDSAALFPARIIPTRAYLQQGQSVLAIRDIIASSMNQGQLIVQYIGHAGRTQWTTGGGIWSTTRSGGQSNDLDLLTPTERLPMSLPWACWDGYFVEPGENALSEAMMRLPDRGIIGAFSPTGLDVATGHDALTRGFYKALFNRLGLPQGPVTEFGPLTLYAKLDLITEEPAYERLIYTFMLYGDPATHLALDPCVNNPGSSCTLVDAPTIQP